MAFGAGTKSRTRDPLITSSLWYSENHGFTRVARLLIINKWHTFSIIMSRICPAIG